MGSLSEKTAGTIVSQISKGDYKAFINTYNQLMRAHGNNFLFLDKKDKDGNPVAGSGTTTYIEHAIKSYVGKGVSEAAQQKNQKEIQEINIRYANSRKESGEEFQKHKQEGYEIYKAEIQKFKNEYQEKKEKLEKKETILGVIALISVFTGIGLFAAIPLGIIASKNNGELDTLKNSYKEDFNEVRDMAREKQNEYIQPYKQSYYKESKNIDKQEEREILKTTIKNKGLEEQVYTHALDKALKAGNEFLNNLNK